jgi:hypothetical protein
LLYSISHRESDRSLRKGSPSTSAAGERRRRRRMDLRAKKPKTALPFLT